MPSAPHPLLAQAEQLFRSGGAPQAEAMLRAIIDKPDAPARAFELLAFIHGNQGDLAGCEHYLASAVALPDCSAEAHFYLGRVRLQRGSAREAIACFERAIREAGEFFEALHEIGVAHSATGEHALALAAFERAARINDRVPELQLNLGSSLLALQRPQQAVVHFERALKLQPQLARAWSERAMALAELGRLDDAIASCERALQFAPQDVYASMNRVALLESTGRQDAAREALSRLAQLPADTGYLRGYWLHDRMLACRWDGYPSLLQETCGRVLAGEQAAEPFALLPTGADPEVLLACAKRYAQDHAVPARGPAPAPPDAAPRRLRIGYFSSGFGPHPTSQLIARLFECHDRARFESFGFSFGPPISDPLGRRVMQSLDHFDEVANRDDAQIAALAREAGIDIAIDLNGYIEGSRPGIFAHRAAPLQVSYLGYPGTMGADFIDYILADAVVIRPEEQRFYSEKVVRLPGSYQCNDELAEVAPCTSTRAQAGLPADGFVFACFNNNYKITPDVFEVWMRLLSAVPGSVLWLLEGHAGAPSSLAAEARRLGVDPSRIVWAKRSSHAEHLSRHALADLFLDTFHYNAHTTCSDALRAGLPVLTREGDTFAARVASSLLGAMGLPELVTHDVASYEARALELAGSSQQLAAVRGKLLQQREASGVFDARRFTRHFEAACEAMWARHVAGLPPEPIDVAPFAA
ncbi:glycosyltransferase family 41 protein [Variovorax sp. YR216]|uniref:O-linked N-acetylglucosamine transferase, SPINDLY family protein n=1 Tax=Variovorax sp. YR216 TaxID=1882828 RepID=UPI000896846A|nr:glycosyltransferase family 41 protein [Variovorax sp. YR216]SEB19081.1 Predicted O-linked N-acetylglucosamine transferase, SPINDLY family [Variovorax sp. YR216]